MKPIGNPLTRATTGKARGFSLVITLMMMVLLTIIALGLLSLSTITLRSADAGSATARAQANAKLALMLAIGDLQKYAGPDQRVTAPADITGASTNTRWTGVWSTTKLDNPSQPMVGGYASPNYFSDLRNTDSTLRSGAWKTNLRLGWLVSGTSPAPVGTANTIELVGEGSLGTAPAAKDRVTVPSVLVNTSTKDAGAVAYWVGDESQKVRIDQGSPYNNKTANPAALTDGGYYRLAGADGPGFAKVKAGSTVPYAAVDAMTSVDRAKMISRSSVGLPLADPKEPPRKNFHDITTKSQSVLSDVRDGGLKKDLTAYLEVPAGVPAVFGVQGTGLSSTQAMLPGAKYADMGPNFAHLKSWYDLRTKVTGTNPTSATIVPQYLPSRSYTAPSGSWIPGEGNTLDLTKRAQAIQPVMTQARMAYDFSLDTTRAAGRGVRFHVYPRVTLWNPYNVTLKGARYLVGFSMQGLGSNVLVGGKSIVSIPGDPNSGQMYAGINSEKMVYFMTSSVDFGPGECLVFSPDYSASSGGTKIGGNSVQYSATDIAANVLSASIPTGQNNFYFPTGFKVDDTVNLAAGPIVYGASGSDPNSAIANGKAFVLKKADSTGSVSYSTMKSSAANATIGELLMDYNGQKLSWWWEVFGFSDAAVNNAALPGFVDYATSPNRNPPRLWYTEGRLRWLDETDEQQALGQNWGKGAELLYHNPVIAQFNVRSPLVHRSPFCYYDDWTRYAPGPSMVPWASPRLGDSRMQLPYLNGKSYGSPFGLPSDWSAIKSYAMFDVPVKGMPLFSLAALQHAQIGYEGWDPTYVIGHSLAEPRSARDSSVNVDFFNATPWTGNFAKHTPGVWDELLQGKTTETLIYDKCFSVNQALWDRFYLSTIPYDTSGSGVMQWNLLTDLPNSRHTLQRPAGMTDTTIKTFITSTKTFDYSSYFLMNKGAFNINSTSVEAWRAFFSTLNRVSRPDAAGASAINNFSRLLMPRTSSAPVSTKTAGAWAGSRVLSDGEIETLANRMVDVIKARGPFLGMADFVNRRLAVATSSNYDDESFCGPLQAAIEKANLNTKLQGTADETKRNISNSANDGGGGTFRPDVAAYFGWKTYGAPGYLTQADILQTLAPNMTTRGDTFVVRGYGDARDPSGKILARAWCEATVQRTADWVIGNSVQQTSTATGNNPLEPVTIRSTGGFTLSTNSSLMAVNQKMGRKLLITDFRWLNKSEI